MPGQFEQEIQADRVEGMAVLVHDHLVRSRQRPHVRRYGSDGGTLSDEEIERRLHPANDWNLRPE